MKNLTLFGLSLVLITTTSVVADNYTNNTISGLSAVDSCWSNVLHYDCCSEEIREKDSNYKDEFGFWYSPDGTDYWCGVKSECWASQFFSNKECCNENDKVKKINQDGRWGYHEDTKRECGFSEFNPQWADVTKDEDSKDDWEDFKDQWDQQYRDDYTGLSVFVGKDESELNFAWYSTTPDVPMIRWSVFSDFSNSTIFSGTNEIHYLLNKVQYYSNKVTVQNLERHSVYYYSRFMNGAWEEPIQFNTYDDQNFSFIFVGDPQIGGSKDRITVHKNGLLRRIGNEEGVRNDAFNWIKTVKSSFDFTKTPSVFLSAGDQTDDEYGYVEDNLILQESQYSAFLLPDLLKRIPTATAVGNHDQYTTNYRHHFNSPNAYTEPSYKTDNKNDTKNVIAGYNYYFKYNNVLTVVLETNHVSCEDFKIVIRNAVKEYPRTDWRIAMFHHDIYSNGYEHSRQDHVYRLRHCLSPLFTKYNFVLVINGHDHIYSASKFVRSYKELGNKYWVDDIKVNEPNPDPKGTLYITANCSTGSKLFYYNSDTPNFIKNNTQTFTTQFGVVDFQKENGLARLSVTIREVQTHRLLDGPYIMEKQECWAHAYGYECCRYPDSKVRTIDDEGHRWSVLDGRKCGVVDEEELEEIYAKIEEEKVEGCWSLPFPCCKNPETKRTLTDKD